MILALALLALGAHDPRPELIELVLEGRHEAALVEVEKTLVNEPEISRRWGLEYLLGHLLEQSPLRYEEAPAAFRNAMISLPALANRSRHRLARQALTAGHPQVAAALLGQLLASDPSPSLTSKAVQLLERAVPQGGYCQVLSASGTWSLTPSQRRRVRLVQADCEATAGKLESAVALLGELLREDHEDDTAIGVAERLARQAPRSLSADTTARMGLAFFHHREFRRAATLLESSLATPRSKDNLRGIDPGEVLYALARCAFWSGEYSAAAERFATVARQESTATGTARALFQRARCLELEGNWEAAAAAYRRAFEADRNGNWAPAALLAALRIDWRQGREESALELFDQLRSRGGWQRVADRAALFLAVSDIVRGQSRRASDWLATAGRGRGSSSLEVAYWQGRVAELQGNAMDALSSYHSVLLDDFYHPLAAAAYARLGQPPLAQLAVADAEKRASSRQSRDLYLAWLLLGDSRESGRQARTRLTSRLAGSARTRPFVEMQMRRPATWKLWDLRLAQPEDHLLTLGIVEEMSAAVRRALPLDDLGSALAASRLLSVSNLPTPSLYVAEVVSQRLPSDFPHRFLPSAYRRLLYPRPYRDLVAREATRFAVDPNLLTAIIREESRFDTQAVSPASARGLTQFVTPTARQLAARLGWPPIQPLDLHRPEISLPLGAAYLRELAERFDGRPEVVIAAYNAGEDQARLWLSYCYSREPEEYFSKVGFVQTRDYLNKVSSSRAQYREIYGAAPPTP